MTGGSGVPGYAAVKRGRKVDLPFITQGTVYGAGTTSLML